MPRLPLLALLLLGGCATAPDAPDVHPEHQTKLICRSEAGQRFIGQRVSQELGRAILRATNSETFRWSPPHTYLTENWHPWRVTVAYGLDRRVTSVECG